MTVSSKNLTESVSAQDMKVKNKKAILNTLSQDGPYSRTELASRLNLSKTTVSTLVNELLKGKLLIETGSISSSGAGRNPVEIKFNANFGYVLGIDIGRYWLRLSLSNLKGDFLKKEFRNLSTSKTLEDLLDHISNGTDELLTQVDIPHKQILSVCVSTPGIINRDGTLKRTLALPQLEGVNLKEHLDKIFPETSVWIENDVNVATAAESWKGIGAKYSTFVFLGIGSGLGSGLIINGKLFRGADGASGEIGFMRTGLDDETPIEYQLSSEGIVKAAKELIPTSEHLFSDVKSVFEAVSQGIDGQEVFVNWLVKRLVYLIQIFSYVIDPEAIILGGGIGRNLGFIMPALRNQLSQLTEPPIIEISKLDDDIQLKGATQLALNQIADTLLELSSKF